MDNDNIENIKQSFDIINRNLNKSLDDYSSHVMNYKNNIDLYNQYNSVQAKLNGNIKSLNDNISVNKRKSYYKEQNLDEIEKTNNLLNSIYNTYLIYFFLFLIIVPSGYSYVKRLTIGILFYLLPYILNNSLYYIIEFLGFFYKNLPRNVNLRK